MKRISVVLTAAACFHSHYVWGQASRQMATNTVKPEYPYGARSHHWEGSGVLQLHLQPDGTVKSVTLLKSCGYRILDESAIKAYGQWHFHAGVNDVRLPFTFTMH
jgi:TonB family protein